MFEKQNLSPDFKELNSVSVNSITKKGQLAKAEKRVP